MAGSETKGPSSTGVSRNRRRAGQKTAATLATEFVTTVHPGPDPGRPMHSVIRRGTIEDCLEAKAVVADTRDYSGQRSLSDMSDDELIGFFSAG